MAKNTNKKKNDNKRHTFFDAAVKNASLKKVKIVQGKFEMSSFAGLALIVNILASATCLLKLDSLLPPPNGHPKNWIPYSSIAKLMIAMLCLRCRHFEDARKFHQETLMRHLVGMTVSPETLRQKMDFLATIPEAVRIIEEAAIQLMAKTTFQQVDFGDRKLVPLDIDPTPLDNSGSSKEKTGPVYDGSWGYCPMIATLGTMPLFSELRPGQQHSFKDTPDFVERCLLGTDALCLPRNGVLVRGDAGVDGAGLMERIARLGAFFLIKRNKRSNKDLEGAALLAEARKQGVQPELDGHLRGRRYYRFEISDCPDGLEGLGIHCIVEVRTEQFMPDGKPYLAEELSAEAAVWWTNLPDPDPKTVVMLYHDHATMEQHHGEVKSDLGVERLPSGKFATNSLYLQLAYIAFTVLRLIGDKAVMCDPSISHRKSRPAPKRLRIGTILNRYVFVPCRLAWHSRQFQIAIDCNYAHFEAFKEIYAQC